MKNCQCLCDTLVSCSCDKVGQPTMMKPETNCFDFCITDSILGCVTQIALCAAAIVMVWVLLKYITEWIKLRRERKIEETIRSEKFKRECQSKILEYMEKKEIKDEASLANCAYLQVLNKFLKGKDDLFTN